MTAEEKIRRALAHVPATDRDVWLRMGMAIKSELDEDGFRVWDEWSQQASSYNERDSRAVWKSIKPNGRITAGTLFHEAQRHGFCVNGHPVERSESTRHKHEYPQLDQERSQQEAAVKARAIWDKAQPAPQSHPYLLARKIDPNGTRCYEGMLCVPLLSDGEICSLQFIHDDGGKRFLQGSRVKGCHFLIGKPNGVICVAEGFATAATVHEATGHAVAVAFNAGNLVPVSEALRRAYPESRLILCADDDVSTIGNPGLTKARDAALLVGGYLAVPTFGDSRPNGATDFNDLRRLHGVDKVRECVEGARNLRHEKAGRIAYRRISDVQAKPIRWLWQGRIARGKVSMLAGNPGLGKSQITASMAAVVTTGGQWPVDRSRCERGNVVFLSAEDDAADTIRPRLEAAGADLSRVFILDAVVQAYQADGSEVRRAFSLKSDLSRLAAMLDEIGDVAMVVIDPVTAYLGNDTDSYKNSDIRALLAPLSELAAERSAAVICVSHLNKGGGAEALLRVSGSLAFVAAARAAFLIAKDPDNESRRLFLPMKNNIGNDQSGFAFTVQPYTIDSTVGVIQTSRISWETEAVTVTADEAMAPKPDDEDRSVLDDAMAFLNVVLRNGPVPAKNIFREAKDAGHAERTIRRAQKALGIVPVKEGMREPWTWALPAKMAKPPEDGHLNRLDTFGNLGHLRAVGSTETDGEVIT